MYVCVCVNIHAGPPGVTRNKGIYHSCGGRHQPRTSIVTQERLDRDGLQDKEDIKVCLFSTKACWDMDVSDFVSAWSAGSGVSQEDWFPLWERFEAPQLLPKKSNRAARKQRMFTLCKFCPGEWNLERKYEDTRTHANLCHPEDVKTN